MAIEWRMRGEMEFAQVGQFELRRSVYPTLPTFVYLNFGQVLEINIGDDDANEAEAITWIHGTCTTTLAALDSDGTSPLERFASQQKTMPPEFAKVIDDNFKDL
jgi:hypothetical protein